MLIHVVQPGETVQMIANRYQVNMQRIIDINAIYELPHLISGMALIIPGDAGNQLRAIEVNAWIEPSYYQQNPRLIDEAAPSLTYISPFSYQVNADGSLQPLDDLAVIEAAREYNVAGLMVLTNLGEGNFDPQIAHAILSDENIQDLLIGNILQVLKAKGYYGVNFDLERIPPEDRQLYNDFVDKAYALLHSENYVLSTDLAPKPYDITTGEWHGAHDYAAQGRINDFVVLMTYDWGYAGGPPMAVAPINEVREVLDYAVSVIPPEKVMFGIPLYGYDWTLPYAPGGEWAVRVTPISALQLAAQYGATVQYDEEAQAPYFYYTDEKGSSHVVWFEDARSIQAKLELINEYQLRGVSYWQLDNSFPQNWYILNHMFSIIKRI